MELRKSRMTEDWLAVVIGLFLFALSLGVFAGADLLGWAVTTTVWTNLSKALTTASKTYAGLPGIAALLLTYLFLLVLMTFGAAALRANVREFVKGFSIVFLISYLCWIAGSWAYIAATPDKLKSLHIGWSMNLTSEAGYVVALVAGLIVGNFMPGLAAYMKEAIRPELYIKTAIVILGGFLGVTAAEQLGLASSVIFRGLCAIVEAYLIYWALVYFIARRYFGFSREWAVPLASGISICGVSAAIATGAAIKARPVVPIMVSSLVVIFAVVELLFLPFVAQHYLYKEPMVAGAWMGLAVKTDGAAVASGAIAESLILAKALAVDGVRYKEGWIMATTTTVKVFIDVFICIWACILAWIWSAKIERRPGEKVRVGRDLQPFPKVHPGLPSHLRGHHAGGHYAARPGRKGKGRHGAGQRISRHFLRDDVLHDRRGLQLPKTLGRGDWPLGARVRSLSVWVHHLVRAGHLVALLPRGEAAPALGGSMKEPKLSEELKKMQHEPLLAVEKRLIIWSLGLGVVLLVLLVWVSHRFI